METARDKTTVEENRCQKITAGRNGRLRASGTDYYGDDGKSGAGDGNNEVAMRCLVLVLVMKQVRRLGDRRKVNGFMGGQSRIVDEPGPGEFVSENERRRRQWWW